MRLLCGDPNVLRRILAEISAQKPLEDLVHVEHEARQGHRACVSMFAKSGALMNQRDKGERGLVVARATVQPVYRCSQTCSIQRNPREVAKESVRGAGEAEANVRGLHDGGGKA